MITKPNISIIGKNIALGAMLAGCMALTNAANAQCYSETYGNYIWGSSTGYDFTTTGPLWSATLPVDPPHGPYNGCTLEQWATYGVTGYTSGDNNGIYSEYDGTPSWTWTKDLTRLDPNKTYLIEASFGTQNLNHIRHLTMDYNFGGVITGSHTTGMPDVNRTAIVTGVTSLHFTGTLHCDGYVNCEPAQELNVPLRVREVIKNPALPPTAVGNFGGLAFNICPATGVNLSNTLTSTCPSGFEVEWHTGTPATDANKVADPTSVPTGVYAAVCRKTTGDRCYSDFSDPIYAVAFPCGGFGGFGGRPAENAISFRSDVGNGHGIMQTPGAEELNLKYGTPILVEGDADQIFINMGADGNYNVVSKKTGVYKFNVPLISSTDFGSQVPSVPLTVTVTSGIVTAAIVDAQAYVMPNPVSGNAFSFVFVNAQIDNLPLNIRVTDVNGRAVYTSVQNVARGSNKIQIQTKGLAKGIYYLNYINAEFKINGKLKVAIN